MITAFNLDWEDRRDNNDLNEIKDLFPNLDRSKLSELFGEDRSVFVDEILSEIMDLLKSGMKKEVKALKIKMAKKSEAESPLQPELKSYIMDFLENGKSLRLDGDLIQKEWFPDKDCDVFLSHSHNDLDNALKIKVLLEHFGLKVFVDSTVWGFADNLLRKIDDAYAQRSEGYYSYNKRNRSTAAVHLMLSTALTQVMDNAEAVFFLNTPNSTLKHFAGTEYDKTLIASPWIYHEIMMTKFLRPNSFRGREKDIINESEKYENIIMPHCVDLSQMQKLSLSKFARWISILCKKGYFQKDIPINESQVFGVGRYKVSDILEHRRIIIMNHIILNEKIINRSF